MLEPSGLVIKLEDGKIIEEDAGSHVDMSAVENKSNLACLNLWTGSRTAEREHYQPDEWMKVWSQDTDKQIAGQVGGCKILQTGPKLLGLGAMSR